MYNIQPMVDAISDHRIYCRKTVITLAGVKLDFYQLSNIH